MSRVTNIVHIVSLTLFLLNSACVLGPSESSAPRSYFLNPEISWKNPHGLGERTGTAVLLITQPKAQAGFDSARMAYQLRPYELNYYALNQWADTPARLLHQLMVEHLDKTGHWSAVLQAPSALAAHYRLDTDNLILEQQFFSRPSRVRLALRVQIVDLKKSSILATRYFEFIESTPSDDPYGGVQAANHAVKKLIVELTEWLDNVTKGIE